MFAAQAAVVAGEDLDVLLRTVRKKTGPPSGIDITRREALAKIIVSTHKTGATFFTIAEALGLNEKTVAGLAHSVLPD